MRNRRRRALYSLYLFLAIFLLLGGLALALPMGRAGCICLPRNPIMKSLPQSSLDETIPGAQEKTCCER